MRSRLQREIEEHPLRLLLIVGVALRVVASVFARGYMATDDHNQVIELAAEWSRGDDIYLVGDKQFYRSLLYPYLNYMQISACHTFGVVHPDVVMLINRLLHAMFSLWTIALTYSLGLKLSDRPSAFAAGLLVTAHAVMPYAAVRNLIEVVCMPFLLWGVLEIAKAEEVEQPSLRPWIVAGLAFGLGFLIRWQIASAIAGVGVYLLIKRQWRGVVLISLAFCVPVVLEGLWDWQAHGVFLGSLWRYIEHNALHAYDYVVGPWYRYLLLILGIFIPPISLFCVYASGKYIKRLGILAWAVLPFVIVHSLVPGKQERFLLPIFPLLAIMFVVALWYWRQECSERIRRLIGHSWTWFWVVNAVLLIGALTHYGQRGKIEPLIGLYEQESVTGVIVDVSERGRRTDLPMFYLDGGGVRAMPIVEQATSMAQIDSLLRDSESWSHIVYFGSPESGSGMLRDRYGRKVEIVRHTGPTIVERALLKLNPKYTHSRESWMLRIVRE